MTLADFSLVDFGQRVMFDKQWIKRAEPLLERFPKMASYFQKRFEDHKFKAYLERKPKQD